MNKLFAYNSHRIRILIRVFFISFLLSSTFFVGINIFQKNLENFFYAQIGKPFEEISLVKVPKKENLELNAKSAISLRINKNGKEKIIFEKNPNEILPIASLTKLMTALIVLEDPESYQFSKIVTISKEAASQEDVPEGGNLKFGEKVSVKKLLDLMLIHSSNDAAFALAEEIGINNFVERMNRKAKILGILNTHFVNPTGLDPESLHYLKEAKSYFNYSTANDLVKLAKYILNEFPLIYEISIGKPYYQIKNGFSDLVLNFYLIGGKTGYTDEAGGCMILVLENEKGTRFINLILGTKNAQDRIEEMQKIINFIKK